MFTNIARAVEAETTLIYSFPGMNSATVADPGEYIRTVFMFALGVVGLAALAFLVYGGIRYILSAGNPSALADAKDRMLAALIGIVLLLSSYLILNTVDPRLLQLTITDIAPVTPQNINFAAIEAWANDIIALINAGDIAGAKAKREEARAKGLDELRAVEGMMISGDPAAAAKLFTEGLDFGEQKLLIQRALLNKPGAPGYNAQSEYNPSLLVQRVPTETLYGIYWQLSPEAQRELLLNMSGNQLQAFYWNLGDPEKGGGAYQQNTYLNTLNDFSRTRLYLDFQNDGQGNGVRLVNQITEFNNEMEIRGIMGIWAGLPEGATRETFIRQVKNTGKFFATFEEANRASYARHPADEDRAIAERTEFLRDFAH